MTKIAWADKTWNPVTGCSPVSSGCANCYADRMAKRLAGRFGYPKDDPFKPGTFHPDKIDINLFSPGKSVFVSSMGDLFHEAVNIRGDELRSVFRCMSHHDNTFLLLTKRPGRMAACIEYLYGGDFAEQMPHVYLGVTVELQKYDHRIIDLLQIPAAVRFVSAEPILAPINITKYLPIDTIGGVEMENWIDWVVCGCESGPNRRPCELEWVRDLVEQCRSAGVPVFIKQLNLLGKVEHDINKFPKDLQMREYPR